MASNAATKRSSSAITESPRRRPRRRPRRDEPEPIPVLGGRLLTAAIAGFGMLVVFFFEGSIKTPEPAPTDMSGWHVGGRSKVRLTVITMDYERLTCASEKSFGQEHCEYKAENQLFPREPGDPLDDSKKHIIQPYRTYPDNQLILASGVWSHPSTATRTHIEPWAGIPEQRQMRFVAECEVEFLGQLENVKLRWKPDQSWNTEAKAWVAKTLSCKIGDTE
jgi:hypothetical protein